MHKLIKSINLITLIFILFILSSTFVMADALNSGATPTPTCTPDKIISAIYSSDGQHIITGSRDGIVRIWDTNNGQLLSSFTHPNSRPIRVALAQEDDTIITFDISDITNQTTSTIVWNEDGTMVNTFPGSYGGVVAGNLLLTNGNGATARLWDMTTGDEVKRLEKPFFNPVISADGQQVIDWNSLAVGFPELWTFPEAQKRYTFPQVDPLTLQEVKPELGAVSAVAFSSDGKYAALVTNGNIVIWDLAKPEVRSVIPKVTSNQLAFSPSGHYLLIGSLGSFGANRNVILWDLETQSAVQQFPSVTSNSYLKALAFSPDGTQILIIDNDFIVHTWDISTGKMLFVFDSCLSQ